MVTIEVNVKHYLAEYARAKYTESDWGVLFPHDSLVAQGVMNLTSIRPRTETYRRGNLRIAIRERQCLKDMRRYNYLTLTAMKRVGDLLYIDFKATLCEYMDRQYYTHGIDYKISAMRFAERYKLESITVDGLLKMHIRWKHQRKKFRRQAEQQEINF